MQTGNRTQPAPADEIQTTLRDVTRFLEGEYRKGWADSNPNTRIPRQQEIARLLHGIRSIHIKIGKPDGNEPENPIHTALQSR
jgi:hypothetical protein